VVNFTTHHNNERARIIAKGQRAMVKVDRRAKLRVMRLAPHITGGVQLEIGFYPHYIFNKDNNPVLNSLAVNDLDYLEREYLKTTKKIRTVELWACIMMRPPDPERSLSYQGDTPPVCKTCDVYEDETAICALKIARAKTEKNRLRAQQKGFYLIDSPNK
jgi:hypothetical protein